MDLISTGAPLPEILNNLCTTVDLQVGNIVSVMLLPDDTERDFNTIAKGALQFGLHLYWSADIALRDEDVLGIFRNVLLRSSKAYSTRIEADRAGDASRGDCDSTYHGDEDLSGACGEWKQVLEKRLHVAAHMN